MKILNDLNNKKIFYILLIWLILCILNIFSIPQFEGFDEDFHYFMSLNNDLNGVRWIYHFFHLFPEKLSCEINEMQLNPNFKYFSSQYVFNHFGSNTVNCLYYFRLILFSINVTLVFSTIFFVKDQLRKKVFILSIFFPSFLCFLTIFNIRNMSIVLFFVFYLLNFFEKSFLKSLFACLMVYLITSDRSFFVVFLGLVSSYIFIYYKRKESVIKYNMELFATYLLFLLIITTIYLLKFDGIQDMYEIGQEFIYNIQAKDAKSFNLFELFKGLLAIFIQFFYIAGYSSFVGIGIDYIFWFVVIIFILRKRIFNFIFQFNKKQVYQYKVEYFYSLFIVSSCLIWYIMYFFNSFLKAGRYFFYLIPFFIALILYKENEKSKFFSFNNLLIILIFLNIVYIIKNYLYLLLFLKNS
ncbi:hypothetical protein ACWNT8_00560 [Pigmentibacter ruber]